MRHSLKVGFSFGSTSGVITVLGLMVGLYSGTHSKLAVLGAILTIAVADSFSDALGIHVSEESENKHTTKEIWQSTIAAFSAKFVIALTFVLPVIFYTLKTAVIISVVWGFFLLSLFSFLIARQQDSRPWKMIVEHLFIAALVIAATYCVGLFIQSIFGSLPQVFFDQPA